MVYFSKIDRTVINLANITYIKIFDKDEAKVAGRIHFINGISIVLTEAELTQLLSDIDTAATLTRIQREGETK